MAQQDCGQCGYSCADYSNAIVLGSEKLLNLCAPGGKDTTRMVKKLVEELDRSLAPASVPAEPSQVPAAPPSGTGEIGRSRECPAEAVLFHRERLSGSGSEKDTWHLELDLAESGVDYEVGDSLGIFPRNDLGLVDQVIAMLGTAHNKAVRGRTLRQVLEDEVSLGLAPDNLFDLYSYVSGGTIRQKARALARGEDPDGDAGELDVLAVVKKFDAVRPHPEAFVDALDPLQPRLYSISSSSKASPGRVSLTVDAVRYMMGQRKRVGVASTFLSERLGSQERVKFYVQKAHNFALPSDPATPIVMIGPGTGIAPFRAFLQHRKAMQHPGRNWLFFGHQYQATEFFYKDELTVMKQDGLLTRLSLAWSRDSGKKYYVQDRMRESGTELWRWLTEGAHFYICGDAKRMAKDVEAALVDVVATHGARTIDEAVAFVGSLKKSGRYQADVY
jgi:sulfite reductase (NADPH) flavoprotein alpha-component